MEPTQAWEPEGVVWVPLLDAAEIRILVQWEEKAPRQSCFSGKKTLVRRAECFVPVGGHADLKGPMAKAQRPFMLQMRTRGSAFKVSFHIGTPGSFLSPHCMATAPLPSQGLSLLVPLWLHLWSPNELAVSASPLFCRLYALKGSESLLSSGGAGWRHRRRDLLYSLECF